MLAQVAHAAGESAAKLGRALPLDTRVVVLGASAAEMHEIVEFLALPGSSDPAKVAALQAIAAEQAILETEGELAGVHTAIGIVTFNRDALRPLLSHLKPFRP